MKKFFSYFTEGLDAIPCENGVIVVAFFYLLSSFSERLGQSYILEITDTDENHVYSLRYEGSKTIFDVKQGIFALTNIPPRQQKWSGWSVDGDDHVSEGHR